MDELIKEHTYITEPKLSDILYEYIDKYPEDAPKWIEYFRSKTTETELHDRRRRRRYHVLGIDAILETIEFPSEPDDTVNITSETGCLHCKKTWVETPTMVTMNMLCGHRYHTVCSFLYTHYHGAVSCLVENCNCIDINLLVDRIATLRRRRNNELEDVLTNSILENDEFKRHLALMKKQITAVNKTISLYDKNSKKLSNKLFNKHLHSINYIQEDMNCLVKEQASSEEKQNVRSAVSKYRKTAASMFRKFHVSFRDLFRKNMIKTTWRLRHILERHGTVTNNYRFGIRIYPGKRIRRERTVNE